MMVCRRNFQSRRTYKVEYSRSSELVDIVLIISYYLLNTYEHLTWFLYTVQGCIFRGFSLIYTIKGMLRVNC